jgi:hypothetical protein
MVNHNIQALFGGSTLAAVEDVGRRINAIDVDPASAQRQERVTGTATEFESGLPGHLDESRSTRRPGRRR